VELRSARDLARLWGRAGAPRPATFSRLRLGRWFAEGFDIADLKEEKALLDELT
jgi:hypothetical protein